MELHSGRLLSHSQILKQAGKTGKGKRSSLTGLFVRDEEKKFCNIDSKDQCYKTFFVRNLRIFVIS
jgi:hypothetical protein